MIRAVIFDMDGVLVDAKEWHYEALNRALGLFGFAISRYDHLVTYDGLPTRKKLEMLTRERDLPLELHGFINEMKQIYTTRFIHEQCKPRFIHEFALSRLRRDGYRLAVCSNAVRSSVELMLGQCDLLRQLEFCLSNEDVTRPKPDPEMYTTAITRMGLEPSECLVIEDNENGIRSARDAGAHVMVVGSVHDVTYEKIMAQIEALPVTRRAEEVACPV
jgi:HAD superfamily hydrolase (TIGR01509 family)